MSVEGGSPSTPEVTPVDPARVPDLVRVAADAAVAKGDGPVVVLDVGPVLGIVDWFVVAGGRNPRQTRAVAEEVEDRVGDALGRRPLQVEGRETWDWVLLDYGEVVIHALRDELRAFYDLERLWADVPRLTWPTGAEGGDDTGASGADAGG